MDSEISLSFFNISVFEPTFSGTAFLDINENGLIDSGEMLKNVQVLFKNGLSTFTDDTGSFFIKKSKLAKDTRIQLSGVKGKIKLYCQSSLNNLTIEELGDRTLSIKCQKNK